LPGRENRPGNAEHAPHWLALPFDAPHDVERGGSLVRNPDAKTRHGRVPNNRPFARWCWLEASKCAVSDEDFHGCHKNQFMVAITLVWLFHFVKQAIIWLQCYPPLTGI
jgi:hypothetical protein